MLTIDSPPFPVAQYIATELRRHTPTSPWTYASLDQRQRQIAEEVRSGHPGSLLLSEVAPVITLGRRTPPDDVPKHFAHSERGIDLFQADRGGLATYHGPGQWVLFPVDHLERLTGDRRGV